MRALSVQSSNLYLTKAVAVRRTPGAFCYNPARNDCASQRHTALQRTEPVIVDVSGVGYEVNIPLSTFYDLDDEKSVVQLLIYTHVKEDALQLFGFKTANERKLFLNFISVTGVGPKLGIALLSRHESRRTDRVDQIQQPGATYTDSRSWQKNRRAPCRRSSRQDELSCLRHKLQNNRAPNRKLSTSLPKTLFAPTRLSALLNLGYQRSAAEKAIDAALGEGGDITVESILRRSLKKLARV